MWIQKIKCKEEKIRDSNHVEDNLELMLDWVLWSCSSYLTPGHEGGDQVRSSWDDWSCSSPDVFHLQAAALSHCGRVRPAQRPTWWRRPLSSRGGRQLRRRAQAEVQGEVETPSALCTEVTASIPQQTLATSWSPHCSGRGSPRCTPATPSVSAASRNRRWTGGRAPTGARRWTGEEPPPTGDTGTARPVLTTGARGPPRPRLRQRAVPRNTVQTNESIVSNYCTLIGTYTATAQTARTALLTQSFY